MKEKGTVIEATNRVAKVSLEPSASCGSCPAGHFCRPSGGIRIIEAENGVDAHVDDVVCVEIPAKSGLIAIFLLFGLPVLLALIGLLIGTSYSETFSIIFGIIGFVAGLVFAKILNNMLGAKQRLLPRIVEIISQKSS